MSERTHICEGCGSWEDVGYLVDATMAALQARVKELESQHEDLAQRNRILRHRPDLPIERTEFHDQFAALQSQLAQRTAELEAAKHDAEVYRKMHAIASMERNLLSNEKADLQAELERVRGELAETKEVEVALSSKVAEYEIELNGDPQNFYGRGRTVGLRTLIAALPKVEGEISVHSRSVMSTDAEYLLTLSDEREAQAYAALLQHRQGMEG